MKKIIKNIIISFVLLFSLGINFSYAATDYLNKMKGADNNNYDIKLSTNTDNGKTISNIALDIADGFKKVMIAISALFFLILAVRLIFSSNPDEEKNNFKKGLIWISIGIVIINLAVTFVSIIYQTNYIGKDSKKMDLSGISNLLLQNIINPIIDLLTYGAAFLFIFIAIYAFFRLVSSNGDENTAKEAKMSIVYAIIGYIFIKISAILVYSIYGKCEKGGGSIMGNFGTICQRTADVSRGVGIIISIINWLNSFVALTVIIMIIYSGVKMIFSNGDEEKYKKFKKSLIYIVIGIGILLFNYFILTFILNNNL